MKNLLATLAGLIAVALVLSIAWKRDNQKTADREAVPPPAYTLPRQTEPEETVPEETEPAETQPREQRLVLTFAGDCTLGNDKTNDFSSVGFRMTVGEDYGYPFRNVQQWLENDDLTLVSLEGVLGDQGIPKVQQFNFRGPGEYVKILAENSVEAVSLANNHSMDFGVAGYEETKRLLKEAGLAFAERNDSVVITLEGGMTVGIYTSVFDSADREAVAAGIRALKDQGADLVIYAACWGREYHFAPSQEQRELAHGAIDAGADIVYGTHPHVLQPIEEYGGGVIFYSLGNFSFGGNAYPADYDTALIRQEVVRQADGTVTLGQRTAVPCSVSSVENRNNYQPTPYEKGSEDYQRVMRKLEGTYDGHRILPH